MGTSRRVPLAAGSQCVGVCFLVLSSALFPVQSQGTPPPPYSISSFIPCLVGLACLGEWLGLGVAAMAWDPGTVWWLQSSELCS